MTNLVTYMVMVIVSEWIRVKMLINSVRKRCIL